jgi:hypothetical protein
MPYIIVSPISKPEINEINTAVNERVPLVTITLPDRIARSSWTNVSRNRVIHFNKVS